MSLWSVNHSFTFPPTPMSSEDSAGQTLMGSLCVYCLPHPHSSLRALPPEPASGILIQPCPERPMHQFVPLLTIKIYPSI